MLLDETKLPNGQTVPRLVHKYFSIDENLLSTLSDGYLWFTDPMDFNDPYDCNLMIDAATEGDQMEKYIQRWPLPKEDISASIQHYGDNPNEFRENLKNEFLNVLKKMGVGVTCFSEKKDNLLMWSHYANKHKVVCLTFDMSKDTSLFSSTSLLKVEYPGEYPRFQYVKYFLENFDQPKKGELLQFTVATKSEEWKYESEIRLVRWAVKHNPFRGAVKFKREALVGVTFGYKSQRGEIDKVLKTIECSGYSVGQIEKAVLKDLGFGLSFNTLN